MGVTGYMCMVYHCFLDDSKDQNQAKVMVSAGFFGTQEQWGSLRIAWTKVLEKHGLEYFKSSECNNLNGEFAKFRTDEYPPPMGRNAAKKIREELQIVLHEHRYIRGVGISVPLEDYRKVLLRPEADGVLHANAYHAALASVMYETVQYIRKRPGRNMVAFVHDDGDDFPELFAVYKAFAKANPGTAKYMGGFQPLDDKLHPPLQLADMVANYAMSKSLVSLESGNMKLENIEMGSNINLLGYWSYDYVLSVLKRNLLGRGRPIPIDLESEQFG